MSFVSWSSALTAAILLISQASAFTGSEYTLTHEYSGVNFFDGWDFFTGRDPTGGFVTYYSRSSSQLEGLIRASQDGPAYMGVNYVDELPFDSKTGRGNGAGRPSVRIASKQAFTHGLFIGDFEHIPAGICGTWPAFWTLGPNWPYTGEVDIMEGVNANTNNVMSLHTNETCIIEGDMTVQTGMLENKNCAYYPDYNVGCGVSDQRTTSFGKGFNAAGGGAYAMHWTSEYIRIWHWPRSQVPADVDSKTPDPSSWGLPAAQLAVGNCSVDQHFQSHKIIFDTTFCGEYAGNPFVWSTDKANSCATSTGLDTCDNYVANNPAAFKDAYWDVNYVRVYQLVDEAGTSTYTSYIASEQPANTATNTAAPTPIPTPNFSANDLCPKYNYSIISDGKYRYEIACDVDPPGPDIPAVPYPGFTANSLGDCILGCTYMNENNGTNSCGGVAHKADINFCYFKKYIDDTPKYRKGFNEVRLIYYGYPEITDNPEIQPPSTLSSVFVEIVPTPQTYRPRGVTTSSVATTTSTVGSVVTSTTSVGETNTTLPPALGDSSISTTSGLPPDYSETVTRTNATSTTSSTPTALTSADPEVTNAEFYIVFNVDAPSRLAKRAISYLAFDKESQSILVSSEIEAAKFRLDANGILMSGQQFVAVDTSTLPPRFLVQDERPDTPIAINVDESGNVSLGGDEVEGVCLQPSGALAIISGGETPEDCEIVVPELVGSDDGAATTTSSTITTSNTAVPVPSGRTSSTLISSTSISATSKSSVSFTLPLASTSGSATSESSLSVTLPLTSTSTSSGSSSSFGPSLNISPSDETRLDISTPLPSSSRTTGTNTATTSLTDTSSSTPISTALIKNSFAYAGCFSIPSTPAVTPGSGISPPLIDPAMTNDLCTSHCKNLTAYYAGTHEQQCFCGTTRDLYHGLLEYPDASCSIPCPGAGRDICGGDVGFGDAVSRTASGGGLVKRQAVLALVSLWSNTELLEMSGEEDVPITTSRSGVSSGLTTSRGSRSSSISGLFSNTGTVTATDTARITVTDDSNLTGGSGSKGSTGSVSYNITGTNTATVISTTYVDVCHVCEGGLKTMATTIAVPHCGVCEHHTTTQPTASFGAMPAMPKVKSPSVPMMTTVKSCRCGEAGAASTITLTVPHMSSIQELAAVVTQMMMAPAVAAAPGPLDSTQAQAEAQAEAQGSAPGVYSGGAPAMPTNSMVNSADNPDTPAAMPAAPGEVPMDDANSPADVQEGYVVKPVRVNTLADLVAPMDEQIVDAGNVPVATSMGMDVNAAATAAPGIPGPTPASPSSSAGISNTAVPAGMSNATTPQPPKLGGNSTGIIESYPTSSGSRFSPPVVGSLVQALWSETRYTLSCLVGAILLGLAAAW